MKTTVRARLSIRYGLVVAASLVLLVVIAFHEAGELRRQHQMEAGGQVAEEEEEWLGPAAEIVIYTAAAAVFISGWFVVRRSLAPISALAEAVDGIRAENLGARLPRSHNGDEVDRMAASFNALAARLEQSFHQIREFTLHASHELKTPLVVMRAEVEKALARAQPAGLEESRRMNETLLDEIERLTGIVNGLTLLAKAESGMMRLANEPVRLDRLVRECYEDTVILGEPHGVSAALVECAEVTVAGDRHRLRQMLLNLADNAVKYNQAGGSVTLRLARDGDRARLAVTNTGPGLPAEECGRVFQRFMRGSDALERGIGGSGLGLAVVRWIVEHHGGGIVFESRPGGPTKVVATLPLAGETGATP